MKLQEFKNLAIGKTVYLKWNNKELMEVLSAHKKTEQFLLSYLTIIGQVQIIEKIQYTNEDRETAIIDFIDSCFRFKVVAEDLAFEQTDLEKIYEAKDLLSGMIEDLEEYNYLNISVKKLKIKRDQANSSMWNKIEEYIKLRKDKNEYTRKI